MATTKSRTIHLILRRGAQGVLVLLVVTAASFRLLSAAGGDVLSGMRKAPFITRATIEHFERIYSLDQSLSVRYFRWLKDASRFELGRSHHYDRPVAGVLWRSFSSTAILAGFAMIMAWAAALSLGVLANRYRGTWIEAGCDVIVTAASSTPTILLALITLLLAASASLLGGEPSPLLYLFGASAMGPMISVAGTSFGALLSGSVIVEQTLNLPGLGSLSVEAIHSRDVPVVMGVVLISAIAVLVGNLLSDLFQLWNDPRV
jgi:ABC-type dipeptide/oligopeptide/nickel transport system permease component